MANDLSLNININAITSGFINAINGVQSSVSGVTDLIKGSLNNVKEGFSEVGEKASGYLNGAIENAAKAQTSTIKLQEYLKNQGVAFNNTAGDIETFTNGITKMSTYSDGEARDALLNLTQNGVKYSDALKSQTALTNLAAGNNMDLSKASDALSQAYGGNYTQLESLGVVTKEQVKNGISYQQVLDAVNSKFGGSAAAQVNSYAGQIKILSNSLDSMKTAIGSALLPILTKLMKIINATIKPMIDFVKAHAKLAAIILTVTTVLGGLIGGFASFQKISLILGPAVSGIVTLVGELSLPMIAVIAAIGALVDAYMNNFGGIKTFIDGTLKKIASAIQVGIDAFDKFHSVAEAIKATLSSLFGADITNKIMAPFLAIRDAVTIVIDIFKGKWQHAKDLLAEGFGLKDGTIDKIISTIKQLEKDCTTIFEGIVSTIKSSFPMIKTIVGDVFEDIVSVWNKVLKPVLALMLKIFASIVDWVAKNWSSIQKTITSVFSEIKRIWSNILQPVLQLIITIMAQVINWISAHWPQIAAIVSADFTAIQAVWNNVLKPVLSFIVQIMGQVVNWIVTNWPEISRTISIVMNTVGGIIKSVLDTIKSIWDANWPYLRDIVSTVWNVIKDVVSTAIKSVEDIIKLVMDIINGNWRDAWKDIVNLVKDIFGGIGKIIMDILKGVGDIFGDIANTAIGWGKDMVEGIVKGIKGGVGDIKGAVGDVANAISAVLHHSVPDEGPLMHDDLWGGDMVKNIADGITNSKGLIKNAINGLATDMSVGIKYNAIPSASSSLISNTATSASNASQNNATSLALHFNGDINLNGYSDVKKFARDLYNIQQDYNRGRGN